MPGDALRPWDNGKVSRPEDPHQADGLDADALPENLWRGSVWPGRVCVLAMVVLRAFLLVPR